MDDQVDTRLACKYGAKCYQKNPEHLKTYKHPPAEPTRKRKLTPESGSTSSCPPKITKLEPSPEITSDNPQKPLKTIPVDINHQEFIKSKFLVDMPDDFYQFWNLCKELNKIKPEEAFKKVGLLLVGPYDVLAKKFEGKLDQSQGNYLIHWRYYYDPPEFQTILKGDNKTGYHIGYFRDSPKELPIFLLSNCASENGELSIKGDNVFAAVFNYLEEFQKISDPFQKAYINKFKKTVKTRADELGLNLQERSDKIKKRNMKIVARSFNKVGIVVPYNRKTQVGYRSLTMSNKELEKFLNDIKNADDRTKLLSKLQETLTNVSIATDEGDFGTAIELGLDILAHGVDGLNMTIKRLLKTNYELMDRSEFGEIIEAHMNDRKKGTDLSII